MPKLKTNKAAAKRFSTTGTGKIKRTTACKQHKLSCKSPKRKRRLRKLNIVSKANHAQVKRMLPYD